MCIRDRFRAGYFLNQKGVMERYPNYKAYYQNVIDITDQLIASNKHALLPNYERVFRNCLLYTSNQYLASYSFSDDQGIMMESGFKRHNIRSVSYTHLVELRAATYTESPIHD